MGQGRWERRAVKSVFKAARSMARIFREISAPSTALPWKQTLKQQRRRAERLWLKTGLTVHKQLYNNEKKLVTKLTEVNKAGM